MTGQTALQKNVHTLPATARQVAVLDQPSLPALKLTVKPNPVTVRHVLSRPEQTVTKQRGLRLPPCLLPNMTSHMITADVNILLRCKVSHHGVWA